MVKSSHEFEMAAFRCTAWRGRLNVFDVLVHFQAPVMLFVVGGRMMDSSAAALTHTHAVPINRRCDCQ